MVKYEEVLGTDDYTKKVICRFSFCHIVTLFSMGVFSDFYNKGFRQKLYYTKDVEKSLSRYSTLNLLSRISYLSLFASKQKTFDNFLETQTIKR